MSFLLLKAKAYVLSFNEYLITPSLPILILILIITSRPMITFKQQIPHQSDFPLLRQKLQQIIQTLLHQKSLFQSKFHNKMQQYQSQLSHKNYIIQQLNHQLSLKQQQLREFINKEEGYIKAVKNLEMELSKIVAVVHSINVPKINFNERQNDPFSKIQVGRINRIKSASKFDINQYFQEIKMISLSPTMSSKHFSQFSPNYKQVNLQAKCLQDLTNTKITSLGKITSKMNALPTQRIASRDTKYVRIREYKENIWEDHQ